MRLKLLVLFSTLLSIAVSAKQVLTTNIEKLDNGQWTVEYISHKPLRSISFVTAQDNSRSERWALITEGFKLQRLNNTDIITRFDGQFFTNVKFKLTPTYTHLPKYYAPFSPFSDGGMLIHSARFFACSDLCSPLENTWYLTLTVPDGDNIVIDGELHQKKVSWWDKNDGKKVYIGQQDIVEETGFVGVIDKAITQSQGKILQQFLPSMMAWLEVRYGRLTTKPMVFASLAAQRMGHLANKEAHYLIKCLCTGMESSLTLIKI